MYKIYKYSIPTKEKYIIELPKDSKIIRVEDVDGLFFLWAIVNTDENHPKEKRCLEFYKTGQVIETPIDRLNYLGTCKLFIMQELCLYVFENTFETSQINSL
jgi:hypothetical protein